MGLRTIVELVGIPRCYLLLGSSCDAVRRAYASCRLWRDSAHPGGLLTITHGGSPRSGESRGLMRGVQSSMHDSRERQVPGMDASSKTGLKTPRAAEFRSGEHRPGDG